MCKRSTQFVLDGGMNDDFFLFYNAFKLYKLAYGTSATLATNSMTLLRAGTSSFQLYNPARCLTPVWGATALGLISF